ncbi:sialoadhesin-like [Chelmon rostratus]|uniref:sialoadhesin-like n=1 Tax=Chelmon rostratus TaxID=109905 RepID=UPI001BE5FC54|nr:sialoadhesin-like [Chelmon rostratus]
MNRVMRGAAMGLTAAETGFFVLFLSVSVALSRNGLTYISAQICAVRGSTVDIRCVYRLPTTIKRRSVTAEKILWFTDVQDKGPVDLRTDSEYAGRVKYYCDKTTCTLRIADLRESDSSEYKFAFKHTQNRRFTRLPGVTLSVTDPDLQVQVRRAFSTQAELFCRSFCHLPQRPSFIWYKNGQKIQEDTSSHLDYFDPADSYSCAVRRHEDFPAPSVCVVGQTCNRVTYTHRSICAAKGSSVDISCTYNSHNNPTESRFWFSPERGRQWLNPSQPEDLRGDSQYDGRVQVITERGRSTLRITDLTESDSAQYRFKFRTRSFEWTSSLPGTTLTVTALQVQVTRIKVHQFYTEVELNCHSSCAPAAHFSYIWFKNGEKFQEETSSYTDDFYPADSISCAFKGHEDSRSLSVYAPKLPSVSVSPSGEIMEGSSVTLTCSSDANPAANYTWYKRNVNLKALSEEAQLVFRSIQSSDSGEYYCAAENELGRRTSQYISINVTYAPKLPSGEIVEGSSVTLTCSSDANPAASYTWYKENEDSPKASGQIFIITDFRGEHSGNYYCEAQNKRGRCNSTLYLLVVAAEQVHQSSSAHDCGVTRGSRNSTTVASATRSAIGIIIACVLFAIVLPFL